MPAEIRIDGDIATVVFRGITSYPEAYEVRQRGAEMTRSRRVWKFLVDMREVTLDPSLLDMYLFTSSLADVFPPEARHAVVYSPAAFDPDRASFNESVARNRGVRLRMFTRPEEAREWLEDRPPGPGG